MEVLLCLEILLKFHRAKTKTNLDTAASSGGLLQSQHQP